MSILLTKTSDNRIAVFLRNGARAIFKGAISSISDCDVDGAGDYLIVTALSNRAVVEARTDLITVTYNGVRYDIARDSFSVKELVC